MTKPVLVRADARPDAVAFAHPLEPRAQVRMTSLGDAAGLARVGVWHNTVAPGKQAFPYHAHHAEEELVYILSGAGTVEAGDATFDVGHGDFVGFPAPQQPHQLACRGDADLVYLSIGERRPVDVIDFPRHGKRMVRVGEGHALHDLGDDTSFPGAPPLSLAGAGPARRIGSGVRDDVPTYSFAHPLNPDGLVHMVSLGDAVGFARHALWINTIPPGKESFVYHSHYTEEEFVYVLSGRGVAEVDGALLDIGPGDFLGFPTPSVAHQLRNPTGEDLVYLSGGERNGSEIAEFPRLGKRLVRVGMRLALHDTAAAQTYPGFEQL